MDLGLPEAAYATALDPGRPLALRRFARRRSRDGAESGGLGRGLLGFWPKVRVVGESPGACWEWIGYRDRDGYGKMTALVAGRSRSLRPHRLLYEHVRGPIPPGLVLLHDCDNPPCVNPWHTRPGTQLENIRGCFARGRHESMPDNRGEQSGNAVLTADAVLFIRAQARVRGSVPVLAKLYGVSVNTVYGVVYRRTWRHLGNGNRANAMTPAQLRSLIASREEEDHA